MKQQICLVMIVKNESRVIERCLLSVKPLITAWVIVDTGSTDETMDLIRKTLAEIPGELHQRPWVDFAHNRNEALQLAMGKSEYLLFMDADEEWKGPGSASLLTKDFYTLRHCLNRTEFLRINFIKSDPRWFWQGRVHETLAHPCRESLCYEEYPAGWVECHPSSSARSFGRNKCLEDAKILEEEHAKNPSDERTVFYLAQTYCDGGDEQRALHYYEMRSKMGGWEEEIFWSMLRIARIKDNLLDYSNAYLFRPSRIEPLYDLAGKTFRKQQFLLCYLLLAHAESIPASSDAVCVERWLYDWGLAFQLVGICLSLGWMEEAKQRGRALLERNVLSEDKQAGLSSLL